MLSGKKYLNKYFIKFQILLNIQLLIRLKLTRRMLMNRKFMAKSLLFVSVVFLLCSSLQASGHIEFNLHYSKWTLNPLRSLIETKVSDALESDLKDRIVQRIQEDYPNLMERSYNQNVRFDSSGNNVGFEIRFYPGGHNGSFSLGLIIEQSTMKVAFPYVAANLELQDAMTQQTAQFIGGANAEFIIKPLSFHFNFRWDIFPRAIIHPYLTFGAGVSTVKSFLDAQYAFSYSGTLTRPGSPAENYQESDSKTLGQIRQERLAEGEDDFPLRVFPILQLNLGLKGRLSRNLHVLFDAGVFNGFLFRGGISFRI